MNKTRRNGLGALPRPGDPGYRLHRTVSALEKALEKGQLKVIRAYFEGLAPADIGDMLRKLTQPELAKALPLVDAQDRHEVFVYLPMSLQLKHVRALNRKQSVELFHDMPPDERADLFMRLTEEEQQRVLPALAQAEREDIRRLTSYEEGTAGAVMTSEYASLEAAQSIEDALLELRRIAPDRETIYSAYVVDDERHLMGVVSLRDLFIAEPHAFVRDVMEERVIKAKVSDTQKAVARKIAKYDLISLPIVDANNHIVGLVTADDAMDVATEESTTAMRKGSAVEEFSQNLLDVSVGLLFRKRVFWLIILVFGNIFSGAGIAYFEDVIAANVALVFFLPLLIDSGGNAGSQVSAMMIRGLGTGEVEMGDWWRLFVREIAVSLLLGLAMAGAVSVLGVVRGGWVIAAIVSIAMASIVLLGSIIGLTLPFIFTRIKLDPASASGPLVTSVIDGMGVLIYFGVAKHLLGI